MPHDYGFLLSIEKQALIRMRDYFEVSKIAVGNEFVARDIAICLKLLDIIDGTDSAFCPNQSEGFVNKYINVRNWKRFLAGGGIDFDKPILKDSLREEKAWRLYNKIKLYKMRKWWD